MSHLKIIDTRIQYWPDQAMQIESAYENSFKFYSKNRPGRGM
jgi:hypothetical protein